MTSAKQAIRATRSGGRSPARGKVVTLTQAVRIRKKARAEGKTVVFTNGVFDLIHRGHVDLLRKAASFGDLLFVGVNSDRSVKTFKDPNRPILPLSDRLAVLSSLEMIDYLVVFSSPTPLRLIRSLLPDVLVKGADYRLSEIVGAAEVIAHGGRVERVRLTGGKSTTAVISTIIRRFG